MSCGVGHRCGLDLALLWLWCRPVATALIRLLVWEPPYATGAALEKTKRQKKKKGKKEISISITFSFIELVTAFIIIFLPYSFSISFAFSQYSRWWI